MCVKEVKVQNRTGGATAKRKRSGGGNAREGKMSLGCGEILLAAFGLWGVYIRPLLMRYAGELVEVMGNAFSRMFRGRPSSDLSTYLPYSASFLHRY